MSDRILTFSQSWKIRTFLRVSRWTCMAISAFSFSGSIASTLSSSMEACKTISGVLSSETLETKNRWILNILKSFKRPLTSPLVLAKKMSQISFHQNLRYRFLIPRLLETFPKFTTVLEELLWSILSVMQGQPYFAKDSQTTLWLDPPKLHQPFETPENHFETKVNVYFILHI